MYSKREADMSGCMITEKQRETTHIYLGPLCRYQYGIDMWGGPEDNPKEGSSRG